jgi:hypothetical protein
VWKQQQQHQQSLELLQRQQLQLTIVPRLQLFIMPSG